MSRIAWLDEEGVLEPARVGGKAASLGQLIGAGLAVPPGFAVPTDAYIASRDHSGHGHEIGALLHAAHGEGVAELSATCAHIRELVAAMPMEPDYEDEVRASYAALAGREGDPRLAVAVRSSAVGEDSASASFAGEHDTYLWVRGADDVVAAIRRCWASLFTDRAISYRFEMGLDHLSLAMGVVVQAMVRPLSAGVAFTLNPADGDRSVVAIDSSWGFGEAVVSGEVTPDSFLVDKVMQDIVSRVVSSKEHELTLDDDDALVIVDLVPPRSTDPSLTDEQVVEVARMARRAERFAGCPQDVEWALVEDAGGGTSVVVLQTRPETVWTRLGSESPADEHSSDPMTSIVTTLISPLHGRQES